MKRTIGALLLGSPLLGALLGGCAINDGQGEDLSRFAKPSAFQLASPTIEATPATRILSGPTTARLILDREDIDLRYTWDGSVPTESSPRYVEPLVVREGGELQVVAFGDGFAASEVARAQFVAPGRTLSNVRVEPAPSKPYAGSGAGTLTDGVAGSGDFRDGRWLGFQSAVTITGDLGERAGLTGVLVGTRQDPGSWIFFPESVRVEVSEEGETFAIWATVEGTSEGSRTHFIEIEAEPRSARWLRITVTPPAKLPEDHPGYPNGKPWLFLDEVIVGTAEGP